MFLGSVGPNRNIDVVILDPTRDGVEQITAEVKDGVPADSKTFTAVSSKELMEERVAWCKTLKKKGDIDDWTPEKENKWVPMVLSWRLKRARYCWRRTSREFWTHRRR